MTADFPTAPSASGYRGTASGRRRGKVSSRLTHRISDTPNGLKNTVGTLAMARKPSPNSATAQFFVNLVDNAFLNHTSDSPQGFGYAVFGKVTSGLDVVQKIAKVKTGNAGIFEDVPKEPVVIQSVKLISSK